MRPTSICLSLAGWRAGLPGREIALVRGVSLSRGNPASARPCHLALSVVASDPLNYVDALNPTIEPLPGRRIPHTGRDHETR